MERLEKRLWLTVYGVVGRRMYGGTSTYLPLKVNMAGVIPIIFASSLLLFPVVLAQFAGGGNPDSFLSRLANFFDPSSAPYLLLYALLIIMFTYFYTAVQFNPVEHADNLKNSGGYVPGIRPGAKRAGSAEQDEHRDGEAVVE